MTNITYDIINTDGVIAYKNQNTTIGFVGYENSGKVKYIFVNPLFRKKCLATQLLRLVKKNRLTNYPSKTY